MKVLEILILIFISYLIWGYIRYDPKLDWVEKEDETLHIILWYNSYHRSNKVERKYIIIL